MSSGTELVGGRLIGEEVGYAEITSDSAGWTTSETVAIEMEADLIDGVSYWLILDASYATSVDGDVQFVRIREDDVNGDAVHSSRAVVQDGGGVRVHVERRYDATVTETKTFVATGERESGSGTGRIDANATTPSYLRAVVRKPTV
jgi:hypothetical protein